MDEYPPGVRAPGERYTGPIADPDAAMRAAMAWEDVLAQAAKYAADPDAPIRAYQSAMAVWKNPGQYAAVPRPKAPAATAAEPAPKRPSDLASRPKASRASPEPEVVQAAAPLAAALGAAVLGGVAAGALLGGTPGIPSAPPGAKRPRTGGRGTTPPLPPLPGFSQAPPSGAVEGYDADPAGPLKLPTPAAPAEPQIEHGPTADAEQGPHVSPMARPKVTPEEAEKRRSVIAGKGLPTGGSIPYVPPRHWTASQPLPRGPRNGYMDTDGNEWVAPRGKLFGERHWDVQLPGGGHLNVTKDGEIDHGRR